MIRRMTAVVGFSLALGFAAIALSGCHAGPLELSGQLTFAGGSPAPNVAVRVYATDAPTLVASTHTDTEGNYAFGSKDLPDGTYKIAFGQPSANRWWHDATTFAAATPVGVRASDPAVVSVQLASGTISGTITGDTGPVAGATVRIEDGDRATEGSSVTTTSTDESGHFASGALPAGDYRVEVSAPGSATRFVAGSPAGAVHLSDAAAFAVEPGVDHPGANLRLTGESTVTGTVADGKAPAGNIAVFAYDAADGRLQTATTSASDGTFTLHGLSATGVTIGLVDLAGRHAIHVVGETDGAYDPGAGNGTISTPPADGTVSVGTVTIPGRDCTPDRYGTGIDLSSTDLSGADLRGCDLARADLSDSQLEGATLTGADLADADLTSAVLTDARLDGADLSGATLRNVATGSIDGTPAQLPADWLAYDGYLIGPGANLTGATIGTFKVPVKGGYTVVKANFTNADLTGATFAGTVLAGDPLTGANLTGADLSAAQLAGVISGGIIGTPKLPPVDWKLAAGYLIGPEADLTGADLTGVDLTDTDLTGANLTDANLTDATIEGTDFTGTTLTGLRSFGVVGTPVNLPATWELTGKSRYLIGPGADLSGGNLTGDVIAANTHITSFGDLTGVDFDDANLTDVTFDHVDLSQTTMNGATLTGTTFTGVTFTGASGRDVVGTPVNLPTDWNLFEGYLIGPGADLSDADLADTKLKSFDLTGANLTGADLAGADLSTGTVAYADLTGADLSGAKLGGADLHNVTAVGTDFTGADLTGADLIEADLTDATLVDATISGTDFTQASVVGMKPLGTVGTPDALPQYWVVSKAGYIVGPGVSFAGADLSGDDLSGTFIVHADFDGSNLAGANLSGVDLSQSSLIGTDLTGTDLTNANLTGVVSGGIVGTPADLPTGWSLVGGVLVPPSTGD